MIKQQMSLFSVTSEVLSCNICSYATHEKKSIFFTLEHDGALCDRRGLSLRFMEFLIPCQSWSYPKILPLEAIINVCGLTVSLAPGLKTTGTLYYTC
jgi:hypothetical protein